MNFRAPDTQEELDAIQAVCRLTDFAGHAPAMITNCWRSHVNPRADACGSGCSQTMDRHRMIVAIATQRMAQWQDALATKAVEEFKSDGKSDDAPKAKTANTKNKNKNNDK